jgi:hypothetical protein
MMCVRNHFFSNMIDCKIPGCFYVFVGVTRNRRGTNNKAINAGLLPKCVILLNIALTAPSTDFVAIKLADLCAKITQSLVNCFCLNILTKKYNNNKQNHKLHAILYSIEDAFLRFSHSVLVLISYCNCDFTKYIKRPIVVLC